ncbi:SDR family NAD(P)-dependent oxidoreductase [Aestuariivivens sediminicola]|uniref:SDR family NAD(P)-dependent oxidoreductase n=1 Tax=Aestuariivivens sediminicola TaxID=2913560 RepID=UPI001F571F4F|nr:SDR family NAD(P)-dependent oxidoreductase [Aestuariivivens sediminicola]
MANHYALITGASQGFGKSMALEFAKRNINLLLVALPNSKLWALSWFIKKNFQVRTLCLELDLSLKDSCYIIDDFIRDNALQIKYLVNNAGILSRGFFEDMDDAFIERQIKVNVLAPTLLTKLLLDNLKKTSPSAILNVSSMAAFFSLQKKQVYGATKAYLLSFSKSLRKELKKDNISVTTVCPGGLNTTTRLCYQNRILGLLPRKSSLNPEEAAVIAIDAMMKRKNVIIPGLINKFFMLLDKLLPEFVKDILTKREIKKI